MVDAYPLDIEVEKRCYMRKIRVMVVDDDKIFRSGLKSILDPEEDLLVVAEAGNARDAVMEAATNNPDIVLMDIRMPEVDGITACRLIRSDHPEVKVLMLTSFEDEEAVLSSILAGAKGYLVKGVSPSELIKAIRAVADDQGLLDPTVTGKVMERLGGLIAKEEERKSQILSDREREVLALVAEGLTNRQIGERLVISENTVRNHVGSILEKLGLTSRTQAAAEAIRSRLIDPKNIH